MTNDAARQTVAELGDLFLQGRLTFKEFVESVPDKLLDDTAVGDLWFLIEHEPKVGGFLGATQQQYEDYREEVQAAIEALRSESSLLCPATEPGMNLVRAVLRGGTGSNTLLTPVNGDESGSPTPTPADARKRRG